MKLNYLMNTENINIFLHFFVQKQTIKLATKAVLDLWRMAWWAACLRASEALNSLSSCIEPHGDSLAQPWVDGSLEVGGWFICI